MALFDKFGRFVVWDAAQSASNAAAIVDEVVKILNDDTNVFNVLWCFNNEDGEPTWTLQPLAKYENGAVKLWNISNEGWYNVGAFHNEDGKVTIYLSGSGLPINNSRFTSDIWEIKSDTNGEWYKLGTRLNEDGDRELYVDQVGNP